MLSTTARYAVPTALALLAVMGCGGTPRRDGDLQLREVTPQFLLSIDATDAAIAADAHGRVALTWVMHGADEGKNVWLAVSRDGGNSFGTPTRVNVAAGRVVSFPEARPLATLGPGGTLIVAWSEQRDDTSSAVDLRVRSSPDLGVTFGSVVTVNDDVAGPPPGLSRRALWRWHQTHNPSPFHGYPALAFVGDGTLFATWLDDRDAAASSDSAPSALYTSVSLDGGQTWSPNSAVSRRVCPCCRPDVSTGPGGIVAVAYRAAAATGRDPAIVISQDAGRSFKRDTIVSLDRWALDACPDQGPRIVSEDGRGGHVAWYTGAEPAGVYAVPWRADAGPGGLKRAVVDGVVGPRSPRLVMFGDAMLVGVEARASQDAVASVFAVRTLEPNGRLSDWTFLGADASSGWLAAAGPRSALACWIEQRGAAGRIRVVHLSGRGSQPAS